MNKGITFLANLILIVILIGLTSVTNDRQSVQENRLKEIKIIKSNNNFVNRSQLLDFLEFNNIQLDLLISDSYSNYKLEKLVESHPAIKNVEVFSNQKGEIKIRVQQKKAIARVKSSTDDYFLDEYGLEMLKPDNCTQQLIVFTGDISNNDHKEIFSLINTINLSEFWSAQITQVHFEDDDVILIPRVGNQKIKVGNLRNIYEKLDKLYHFYKVIIPTKGWEFYKEINLKYNNQIVCTKK
jgi:cell division protein FtsQ